jgi:poly-gamma-glutamate capsule biosynthesis protein CapA/YwtB (metallophosphatase superfamily)
MRPPTSNSRLVIALSVFLAAGCASASRPGAPTEPRGRAATPAPAPPAAAAAPTALPRGAPLVPISPVDPAVRTTARVTVGAVGDVLMHDAVKRAAAVHGARAPDRGFSWLFEPIADLLAAPDLTFANLETPVAPKTNLGARPFVFDAPPAVLGALVRAGFDLVSFANNHAFDQGRPGFLETIDEVTRAGLVPIGVGPAPRASGPVHREVNGLRLAFLGYAHFFNQDGNDCPPPRASAPPCVQAALLDRARAVEDVRAAAAEADAVVVSVHWGDEYQLQPRAEDVALAHRLADAGALVVIGHHPHVLQPIELYRRADGSWAVIVYSLGNFVSNQSRNFVPGVTPPDVAATRDGALVRVELARRDYGRGVSRVEVAGADFVPLWTENDTVEIDRRKEPGRAPAIRVVAIDRALAAARAELAAFPDPVPAERQPAFVRLRQREALLASRRAAVATVLGEDLLRTLTGPELARPTVEAAPAATPAAAR